MQVYFDFLFIISLININTNFQFSVNKEKSHSMEHIRIMDFLQCTAVIQNICFGKWILSVRNQVSSIWSCRIRYKPFVYDQICEWRGLYYHKFIIGGDSFSAGMYEATSGKISFGIKQQSCELINKLKREKKSTVKWRTVYKKQKCIIRCVQLCFRTI